MNDANNKKFKAKNDGSAAGRSSAFSAPRVPSAAELIEENELGRRLIGEWVATKRYEEDADKEWDDFWKLFGERLAELKKAQHAKRQQRKFD